MGARTHAARARVVAARADLLDEVARLEASGRSAIDLPAKARENPVETAALAAGSAFLLLGGPRRVLRALRRAVRGPAAELPPSLLPDEVERTLRKLGSDGEKVRGTLEREFARFLEERSAKGREKDLSETVGGLLSSLLEPAAKRAGRQLAEGLFSPEGPSFGPALERARARWARERAAGGPPSGDQASDEASAGGADRG